MAAEENADYFDHLIFIKRESLSSFSRARGIFAPTCSSAADFRVN